VNTYDTIIIGAGHNGLVAAAYLAKKGRKVLVLERREVLGGQVVTESFGDGFTVDSLHAGGPAPRSSGTQTRLLRAGV
jgi:phytoene dehydrogenase-like protein